MDDRTTGAESTAGRFVTETMLEYDGGRQVTVYLPPDPPEAVVFAGDGQVFSGWGRFLEATDVPSTMVVGVHGLAEEMPRLHEYSPVFDAERFSGHEKFFVEDVPRWVRSRFGVVLPTERTAVFGYSAGGELALAPGFAIRTSTVRSSLARLAGVTNRMARCRVLCRGCTSSPARWSRSSETTRTGGRLLCGMQVRTS